MVTLGLGILMVVFVVGRIRGALKRIPRRPVRSRTEQQWKMRARVVFDSYKFLSGMALIASNVFALGVMIAVLLDPQLGSDQGFQRIIALILLVYGSTPWIILNSSYVSAFAKIYDEYTFGAEGRWIDGAFAALLIACASLALGAVGRIWVTCFALVVLAISVRLGAWLISPAENRPLEEA